jgi:hypothetical protein
LVVVYIPMLTRGEIPSVPLELTNALSDDIVFVDLSSTIKTYYDDPKNPDLGFKGDGHPNQRAQRLIAEELEKIIRSKHLDTAIL